MTDSTGKTAVVTGASRGAGRDVALRLASNGANVVVNYAASADASFITGRTIVIDGGRLMR